KPYAYATGQGGGEFGVWVCTFDDVTADRFVKRVAGKGRVRLGHASYALSEPSAHSEVSFAELLGAGSRTAWEFEFVSPACVRIGRRSSPLLDMRAMLKGLHRRWSVWSDVALAWSPDHEKSVLVTDCSVASVAVDWTPPAYKNQQAYTLAGNLGRVRIEVTDPAATSSVSALLRWGEFCGVGAYTNRGLGAFRLHDTRQPGGRSTVRTAGRREGR
ncbi:MAG: CRISPR system precrRNA processing endoribonuclease RAMP protein Cas6, partial [Nocardioides sp.]